MAQVKVSVITEDKGSAAMRGVAGRVDDLNSKVKGAQAAWAKYTLAAGAAVAVMAGVGKAISGVMSALNEGAALELAQSRFDNLAASIGTTSDALTNQMGAATQGMMSQAQMVSAASDIISLGLADTGDGVVRLSNLVGQLGWDMQVLTLTLANDSMLRLDALGLSMENVKARMEELKAAGVAADEAFDMAVIEAGEAKLELMGSAADSTAGKVKQLAAFWQDAVAAFKQEFAESVGTQLGSIVELIGSNGPQLVEGMGYWGEAAGDWLGNLMAGAASEGMQRQTDDIKDQLRELGVSSQDLAQLEAASTARPLPFIYDAQEGIKYYSDLNAALKETYGMMLALSNENAWAEWATGQRAATAAAEAQRAAAQGAADATATASQQAVRAQMAEGSAVAFATDKYWELGEAGRSLHDSYAVFEYGQYVIEQQAAAVDNLAARHEAYQALVERYNETRAAGGDTFMAQAGMEPANQLFNDNMTTNADALNQLIIGIADNAGTGALGLADLNIQLGEMEPAAARAMVAATVAQQAIEILVGAWQGGQIDTSELLTSVDAVIAELQNKELPAIELDIKAKMDIASGEGIPHGERAWMDMMGETPEIPVEANLEPFESALAQALGQITGTPDADRTLQLLAEYEAVTDTLETDIPAAVKGMPEEGRTITFIPDDKAVQDAITAIDQSRITIYVDYVPVGAPEPRASGGPVAGSTPYWVGEAGPELFVPWTSGSIVPNHRTGGYTGGGEGVSLTLNFYGPTNAADVRRAADDAGRRLLERVQRAGIS